MELNEYYNSTFGKLKLVLMQQVKNDYLLTFESENGFIIQCFDSKKNKILC
jgi:hypothetical protein